MPPAQQAANEQAGPRADMERLKAAIESLGQQLEAAGGLVNEEVGAGLWLECSMPEASRRLGQALPSSLPGGPALTASTTAAA